MKRLAAIDIGTNSVLLLAAEVEGSSFRAVDDLATVTRLGEDLAAGSELSEEAISRTITALEKYQKIIKLRHISDIYCFGTSVLREAKNREAFMERVKRSFGMNVRVLSHKEEAILTFLGALDTEPELNCPMVVVDIGGGSTEVVYGIREDVSFWKSFPVGAVNIKERFQIGEQIDSGKRKEIEEYLFGEFRRIPAYLSSSFFLATGGTATTLAAIDLGLSHYDFKRIDGYELSIHQIQGIFAELNSITAAERAEIPGLEEGRADIILPAMLILLSLMGHMAIFSIKVSVKGARYGLVMSQLQDIDVERIS